MEETFRFQGVDIFSQCKEDLSVRNLDVNFLFSAVHFLVVCKNICLSIY